MSTKTLRTRKVAMELRPGESKEQALARNIADGSVALAATAIDFASPRFEGLDLPLTELADELMRQGNAVNTGDLAGLERMLVSQAVTLNAIYTELARRSSLNMGQYLDASERYLRLALKAQSQCRATVESLAAIKNPPVVYARQANFANGPQQVNNAPTQNNEKPAAPHPRARNHQSVQNKLMEAPHGERLDSRASSTSKHRNQDLEALGAVHRPENL